MGLQHFFVIGPETVYFPKSFVRKTLEMCAEFAHRVPAAKRLTALQRDDALKGKERKGRVFI